jgi:L-amino acid N-acyltransferase YncA
MIRAVSLDDAKAIADIYAWHVLNGTATFELEPPTADEMGARIAAILGKKAVFLVAEEQGQILGYAYATPFRDRPAYQMTCEDSIYLHHEARGHGLGSILLAALIKEAEAIGFRQMMAVAGGGEPASIALHAKHGFEHRGTMQSVGRKFGRWLDTVYMQRSLGAGDEHSPPSEP